MTSGAPHNPYDPAGPRTGATPAPADPRTGVFP